MDVARREVGRGAAEGTVVVAGEQTAGRGRQGRSWLSPQGSIALSVIFRPSLSHLIGIVMVAPLAVVRAVRRATGLETGIKWPNDVLLGGKKVCGVLVESGLKGGQVDYAIAGLGLNVDFDPAAWPDIAAIATSLSAGLGRSLPLGEVLGPLLEELDRLYLSLRAGEPVYREWQAHLETIGQQVTVRGQGWQEEGVAEGVDPDGSLLLRREDGTLRRLFSGEVLSLRS
jgi:BirA family biotin operon repressor/biotin-[acetyl-CoA-carboxylase] ligase